MGAEDWFVVNAREAQWWDRGPRGFLASFDDEENEFPQVGINLFVLGPGEPMSMYHWEADQEDFLVLSGEALLLVDGEERPLRAWDFAHTPAGVAHTIVGAGDGPCVVLAIGAREHSGTADWGGYPVHEVATKHDAAAEEETTDAAVAYARFPKGKPTEYGGWLD